MGSFMGSTRRVVGSIVGSFLENIWVRWWRFECIPQEFVEFVALCSWCVWVKKTSSNNAYNSLVIKKITRVTRTSCYVLRTGDENGRTTEWTRGQRTTTMGHDGTDGQRTYDDDGADGLTADDDERGGNTRGRQAIYT